MNVFNYLREVDGQGNHLNYGASYNINTGEFNPNEGYFVSLVGFEKVYGMPENNNRWQDVILNFLQKNVWDVIGCSEDVFLGFWVHENRLYIDLSEKIMDQNEAIRQGYARNQISIYNANDGTYIYMNKISSDPDLITDKHY